MSKARPSLHTTWGTLDQLKAHRRLTFAIDDALHEGLRVPCVENPAAWDTVTPGLWPADGPCDGCPVLGLCERYLATGAVTHGILANRVIRDPHDVERAERRQLTRAGRAA